MFSNSLIQSCHVKHPNHVKTMAPAQMTTWAAISALVLLVLRAPIVKRVKDYIWNTLFQSLLITLSSRHVFFAK